MVAVMKALYYAACLVASRTAAAEPPPSSALDLQIDPLPLFLHGFATEVGLRSGGHRVFATAIAYDVPGFLDEDSRFSERRNYLLGAGYEYFPNGRGTGLSIGAG